MLTVIPCRPEPIRNATILNGTDRIGHWNQGSAENRTPGDRHLKGHGGEISRHSFAKVYRRHHLRKSQSHWCYNCGGWAAEGAVAVGAAAASASAYNAGVAAGSAYGMGAIYPTLPAGCIYSPFGGVSYYNCGNVWFSPSYGANGVYYRVVPAP